MTVRIPRDAEGVIASIPRLPPMHAPLTVRHHPEDGVTDVRIGHSRCVAHIDLGDLRFVEFDRRGRICGFEFLSTRTGVFADDLPYADELLVALVARGVPVILDTIAPPDQVRPSFGPGCVSWIRDPASSDGRDVVARSSSVMAPAASPRIMSTASRSSTSSSVPLRSWKATSAMTTGPQPRR